MGGLGLRLAGGVLQGAGDAMLAQAKSNRDAMLANIKRNQDLADKQALQSSQFANEKSLKQMDLDANKVTDLTPDEVRAAGLPDKTVAQRGKGGKIDVVSKPSVDGEDVSIRELNVGDNVKYGKFDKKGNFLGYVTEAGGPRYKPTAPNTDPFAGRGLNAQMMNMLIKGDPSTPEYAAAYAQMSRPQTSFDANGSPVFITPDISWARKPAGGGGVGAPSPTSGAGSGGGGAANPSPATAPGQPTITTGSQVKGVDAPRAVADANMEQARKDADLAKSIFFPNGQFDRVVTGTGGVPLTKGRTGSQAIKRSVEVLLRLRTGAAAPEPEVQRYTNMFSPSAFDSDEAAATKMQRLEDFFTDTQKVMGTGGAGPSAPKGLSNGSPSGPPVGTVVNGFRFRGGDPHTENSWERAQ